MKKICFELETITPMFMSGADQGRFELRPPSFKGLLRFWWRAYFWGRQTEVTAAEIARQMSAKEGCIFGTASNKGQKSRCGLRISQSHEKPARTPFPKHLLKVAGRKSFSINILEYLAYGMYEYQRGHGNQFIRDYLPAHSEFRVHVTISEHKDAADQPYFEPDESIEQNVVMSMYLLSVFGAVGAKSRNGFGSFRIKRVNDDPEWFKTYNLPAVFPANGFFEQHIKNDKDPDIPNFTGLSKNIRLFKLQDDYTTWDDCLAQLGEIYRSCKGKLDEPLSCEKRQYIAAPVTIQQRVGGRWRIYDASFLERHAKPYFLRVIQREDGRFDGYILYLPSAYCDGLDRDRNNNLIKKTRVDKDFSVSCDEFNGYLLQQMKPYYPERKEK